MNKNELQVGTTAEQRTTAESGRSASLEQNGLLSAALLSPRYEIVLSYPYCPFKVGDILCRIKNATSDWFHTDEFSPIPGLHLETIETHPHIFRKMNWWENRTAEEMPKKVKSLADNKGDVFEIEEWDMEILVGWINKKERSCCSLLTFKPEYGYIPVSSCRVCGCEIKNDVGDELCAECWSRG